jgi:GAF domain-containing protein
MAPPCERLQRDEARFQYLLQDKSILNVQLLAQENWISDHLRPNCYYCLRKFRPFMRKHHCCACGDVVCSHCNQRRLVKQTSSKQKKPRKVRVCMDCIDKSTTSFMKPSVLEHTESNYNLHLTGATASISSDEELDDDRGLDDLSMSQFEDLDFEQETEAEEDSIEQRRLAILASYNILDTPPEKEFDALCHLASRALASSVAAVGFLDANRQWYKSRRGISQPQLPREIIFCTHLLENNAQDPTIVLDTLKDPRFQAHPLVTDTAKIRFYASAPICDPTSGLILGSVFVMDTQPKPKMPARAMEILHYLSFAAQQLVVSRSSSKDRGVSMQESPTFSPYPQAQSKSQSFACVPEENQKLTGTSKESQQQLKQQLSQSNLVTSQVMGFSERTCLDLLSRITDTQRQLAKQHHVIMHNLQEHTTRFGSIESSVEENFERCCQKKVVLINSQHHHY